jgi:hypothetical protein
MPVSCFEKEKMLVPVHFCYSSGDMDGDQRGSQGEIANDRVIYLLLKSRPNGPKVPSSLFACPFRVESGFRCKRRPASSTIEAKTGAFAYDSSLAAAEERVPTGAIRVTAPFVKIWVQKE